MRAFLSGLLVWAMPALAGEMLTVDEAVRRALANSVQVQAARERRESAADSARSVRGQLLPALSMSEELQHYTSPFSASITFPGVPTPIAFNIRDQNTNSFVVAGRQPLVGLLKISQDFVAANANSDAAQSQLENFELATREAIETGFLRLFEARAAKEVAHVSQQQLGEQLTVSQARVEAGAMTTADVLRVQVARANIQQQELQAGVQESAARIQLLTLLNVPLDADLEFAEPESLQKEAEAAPPALAEATTTALAQRADLKQQLHLLDSAEATSRSRLFALLPDIDLTAAYVRVDGQALAEKDSAYVGVRASWPFWVWGAQWYAHRAALHQAQAARLTNEDANRQVRGEVTGRMDQLRAAASAIDVAKTALSSAEEAYRVTAAVVQAGSGTTTDLLDAQSALTQARLNLVRSKYQRALSRVQLRRAMGG